MKTPKTYRKQQAQPALDRLVQAHAAYQAGDHDAAIKLCDAVLSERRDAKALNLKAMSLSASHELLPAMATYMEAIKTSPGFADAWSNLGILMVRLGDLPRARQVLERAITLAPRSPLFVNNLGVALEAEGDNSAAEAAFRQAIALAAPQEYTYAWTNLAHVLLRTECWAEGWDAYRKRPRALPEGVAEWTGTKDLDGHLLVHAATQGLGDAIQFSRFVPLIVAAFAGKVTIVSPNAMVDWLAPRAGGAELMPKSAYAAMPASERKATFSAAMEIFDAPLLLGALRPEQWPSRPVTPRGPVRRIGLCWRGNRLHSNDHNRSLTSDEASALAADLIAAGAEVVSLVPDDYDAPAGVARFSAHAGPGSAQPTLAATARILEQLDLVVTVDTAIAHLAGDAGLPTWMLTPFVADWRWGNHTSACHWYDSLVLWRQTQPGDWASAIPRLRDALI